MDFTYAWCSSCYLLCKDSTNANVEVVEASPRLNKSDNRLDEAMDAHLVISQRNKPDIKCHADLDLQMPNLLGFIPKMWKGTPNAIIELERAQIVYSNFVLPGYFHSISIREKDGNGRLQRKKVEKVYVDGPQWGKRGQDWWTTYRYEMCSCLGEVADSCDRQISA